jgi:hypothetical protein
MRATEFVTEVSQYRYYNPSTPPVATTAYDAKEMGKNWKQTARQTQSARQDPEYRYYAGKNPLSAPVPIDDPEPLNIPADDELEQLEANIDLGRLRAALKSTMSSLTPVERSVLTQRFFNDMTLDQVAYFMRLTRERVRQIEAKALRKMRHPVRADQLEPFVDPTRVPAPRTPEPVPTVAVASKPKSSVRPVIQTPGGKYDRKAEPATTDDAEELAQMKARYADAQEEYAKRDQWEKERKKRYI